MLEPSILRQLDQLITQIIGADDALLLDQALLREAVSADLTLDDFCDLLAACRQEYYWHLDEMGALVGTKTIDDIPVDFSTITAVAYALTGMLYDRWLQWDAAASVLPLPLDTAYAIVSAEDGDIPLDPAMLHDPALRARLLQIVGVGIQ
jgi:hypothetical protein